MPSDTHEVLYQKLRDNNKQIKTALATKNTESLMNLTAEHRLIMNQLKNAGAPEDPLLFDSIKAVKKELDNVFEAIRKERDEVLKEMHAIGNKRRLRQAYGT